MSSWNERMLGAPQSDDYYEARHIQPFRGNHSFSQSINQSFVRSKKFKIGCVVTLIILVIVIVVPIIASSINQSENPPNSLPVYDYTAVNYPINQSINQWILILPDENGMRSEVIEIVGFYTELGYNVRLIDYFFGGSINQVFNQSISQFIQRYPINQSADYARQSISQLKEKAQSIQLIGYGYGANVALSIQSINQSIDQSISQSVNQSINQSIVQFDSVTEYIDSVVVAYPWIFHDQSIDQSVDQSVDQSIDQSISQSNNQSINPLLKPTFFIIPSLSLFAQNVTTYQSILSINKITCQSINYTNQIDGFAINQSINQSIKTNKTQAHADTLEWLLTHGRVNNQSVNQLIKKGRKSMIANVPIYVAEPFRRSISQPIMPTVVPTINQSIIQSDKQSISQSTIHANNQSITQSINQSINDSPQITILYLPDNKGERYESERLVDFFANIGYRVILIDYSLTNINQSISQTYSVLNLLQADGAKNMIALGFCYGGKVAVTLSQNSSAVIGAGTGHPSRLVPTDAQSINQPIYFAMSQADDWTKATDGWPFFDDLLIAKQILHAGKIYQQNHGWTQNSPESINQLTNKYLSLTNMIGWLAQNVITTA